MTLRRRGFRMVSSPVGSAVRARPDLGPGWGDHEGPGVGGAWRQDAMFLVVGLAC